jgi:tetratricopeptide (TPR) repeat protein
VIRVRRSPLWIFVAFFLSASAAAADLELDEYLQRANAARSRGDWESVASQLAQAINHADMPGNGGVRSAAHLEYGRAMGVLCQYGEAEKYLLLAMEMARKGSGSTVSPLYELGALSVAQKKFGAAVGYFSQLEPMIARESPGRPPAMLVADAYEKHAVALAATGRPEEAQLRRREADRIRETSPKSRSGTITPYGATCR